MEKYPLLLRATIRLAFAFLIVAALLLTRKLLVPLCLSVMLAYLLYPYAQWLEKKKVPRIATNLIVILSFFAILSGIVYTLIALFSGFVDNIAEIKEQVETNLDAFKQILAGFTGFSESSINGWIDSASQTGEYVKQAFTATTNTILSIALLPVYTFLLLFYRDKFRSFISMLIDNSEEGVAQKILDQAEEVVPKYLKGLVIVCFTLMGLNSLGFYLIGVEYPLLFGIIAALFNLIPYLGTVLGYGAVLVFVLGIQGPTVAFAVIAQFFVVQFIENNILTPNITGSYVQINPLVIIFSLIAAGMVWGLPGMLIIIPYLGLFKIVCENIESMEPIGYLLGTRGTERHSITIESLQRRFGWLDEDEKN
ncbi:AI-2E family transporter [Gracilimonas mengyeensis]|uniref:Predicted PurR-regulated permease PerM n=1 Tax=Gracilimonas mengyeensis TaxID=1302730 RepID=A0A521F0D8_9BACT|nr:AI-2E family transporter [Gracilimonas mengyeensis]SMO89658.1 Predicted PurR-regulated permease PerM [Gracilimonas mengyeensis]